jgi:PAS domain S-box-containing protein
MAGKRNESIMMNKILIVDDEPNNLDVLRDCLRDAGFKVLVAQSGEMALKRVEHIKPDIVLLDVNMPGMNGFETCRRLKNNEATKEIPIIFITAKTESASQVEGFEIGAVDYITKPFQTAEVVARVNKHLTIRNLQKQLEAKNAQLQNQIKERELAEKKLKRQEQFLRQIINTIPSLIFVKDWEGRFVLVNQATADIYGSTIQELEGKTDKDFNPNRQQVEQFMMADGQVLTSGHSLLIPEETVMGQNEQMRFFQTIKTPLLNDDGKPELLLGVATDITERKQAEMALKKAKELAEAANRAKSEFLANMSHEIRTPMNAVIGFSEILASKITDKQQKRYLNAIQTAGNSLLTLINDILDLSKIEAGRLELQYEPVELSVIFTEMKQIFNFKVAEKNLDWMMEIDEALPKAVFLDETRLRQVLLNLIGNAVKFTKSGYIKVAAHKRETEHNSQIDLHLVVEDSGIGIPADQQSLIFESFKQQDGQSTRQYGGTGLGLAITKRLVEMMNGQITVKSTPGKGSCFEIILHEVTVAATGKAVKADKSFDFNQFIFEPAQVLVVDDVKSNRFLLEEYLSPLNLEVISASTGQQALLCAEKYHPALILMDLKMPEMDGYEATQQLKNNPNTADIPVIALTASVISYDQMKIEAHGFDGYLAKPVNMQALFSELSRYLKYTEKAAINHNSKEMSFPETIVESAALHQILEEKMRPIWQKNKNLIEMESLNVFAEQLIQLGKKHQAQSLIHYADNLRELAEYFDIAGIELALVDFPNLIKRLNQ